MIYQSLRRKIGQGLVLGARQSVRKENLPRESFRLSTAGLVKLRQEAALLNLLQETEIGNIGRLQRSGIVFAVQDGLDRFIHRHGQRRQPRFVERVPG